MDITSLFLIPTVILAGLIAFLGITKECRFMRSLNHVPYHEQVKSTEVLAPIKVPYL